MSLVDRLCANMVTLYVQTGIVYAVEFSHRSGRDLVNMAKKRTNIIPIIEDARHPMKYRMLVGMVDVIFADVAQPDQVLFCNCTFLVLIFFFIEFCTTCKKMLSGCSWVLAWFFTSLWSCRVFHDET